MHLHASSSVQERRATGNMLTSVELCINSSYRFMLE